MEEEKIENKQDSDEIPMESPSSDMEAIQPSGEIGVASEEETSDKKEEVETESVGEISEKEELKESESEENKETTE